MARDIIQLKVFLIPQTERNTRGARDIECSVQSLGNFGKFEQEGWVVQHAAGLSLLHIFQTVALYF